MAVFYKNIFHILHKQNQNMNKLNTIIVDDEQSARDFMEQFLMEHCPEINIVGVAADVSTAVKLINKNTIDLVLLDIEMPNENGFALFDYFLEPKFETIFCTAYSEYAVKAFQVSAVDYLLKPIGLAKMLEAIEKVKQKRRAKQVSVATMQILKENLAERKLKKIAILIGDSLVFMALNEIEYFEAQGAYTNIHHKNGTDLTVKNLKHFEELLSADKRFFRIHRSYFVNLTLIKKYSKKDGLSIAYNDKVVLPVSREKKEEFEELMELQNLV
jgi:two-component system, LytTR family, response regulator